ncbi:hypothetical protein NUM3379_34720 [Kineococcus sp. NUM-3379]
MAAPTTPAAPPREPVTQAGADVDAGAEVPHRIRCHLDVLLKQRGMTMAQLAARAGITVANLAVLKNGRARAIRFSTLTALCDALDCTPADLLSLDN